MNYKAICIFILLALSVYSCKKDLGNYKYNPPTQPVAVDLQGATFNALVGDTLVVRPYISFPGGDYLKDLSYQWDITVIEVPRTDTYTGYPLKIVYNLAPGTRAAKLTITDKRNGIKYYYDFNISGGTQFSAGRTVLSVQNGVTRLSFVKSDDKTILPDIYGSLQPDVLPANPIQLYAELSPPNYIGAGQVKNYWVLCNDPNKQSVIVDANTMLKKGDFSSQFLIAPATILPGRFETSQGVATGVINGKLYVSITSTAPFAPDFGKFSSASAGNYYLSPYFTRTSNFFFGFDTKANAFVSFDGSGNYRGTDYTVVGDAFDPTGIGAGNLLFMDAVSGNSYAFFKAADGTISEYSFNVDMDNYDTRTLRPLYKRAFIGASFVNADTKWQRSPVDIFYFTSNDVIYRYNPINQSIKALDASFGGKKVSMIKLSADGNTLTAGVDGSLVILDVSVGKNGNITKTINGIPGAPFDMVTVNN